MRFTGVDKNRGDESPDDLPDVFDAPLMLFVEMLLAWLGPLVGDGKMDAGLPPSPPTVWPICATAVENREPAVVRRYVLLNGKEHGYSCSSGCTNSSLVLTGIGTWNDPRSSRHRT